MERLVSGIKPTGDLHIGHLIGAIKNFVEMQKEYESFVFVADLHAITIYNDPKTLSCKIKELVALYMACGLDPKHTTLFVQSENLYHANLSWVLECNAYIGEMNRMTQFKDKSKGNVDAVSCGLYTYPCLMASDILLYDADVVPVGIDQKQHVELTRNIAERFNNKYGKTFIVPKPVIAKHGAKILDLQNPLKKMSKSDENTKGCIFLLDDLEIARKKIMSAITDSESIVKYDPENKPGISNLMTIYSYFAKKTFTEIEAEFENANYGTFKNRVADVAVDYLRDLQEKYNEIMKNDLVDKALNEGIEKTVKIAKTKVEEVFNKVGLKR